MNPLHSSHPLPRRQFLRTTAAAAAFTLVPRSVLGGAGQVPPSAKINTAFIGVGSQGLRVMLSFLKEPDVQAVSVCDPNEGSADFPQWSQNEFRDGVRRLIGTGTGWDWLSPNQPMIPLTRTQSVPAGMAGRDPCRKIVEGITAASSAPANTAVVPPTTISASSWKRRKTLTPSWSARRTTSTRPSRSPRSGRADTSIARSR